MELTTHEVLGLPLVPLGMDSPHYTGIARVVARVLHAAVRAVARGGGAVD